MSTTSQRIAIAALLSGGLVACGSEAPAPREQINTVVDPPAANAPQSESGFGPRKEHWAPLTDVPTADPYGESGFGPRKKHWPPLTDAPSADPYGESGFGPLR